MVTSLVGVEKARGFVANDTQSDAFFRPKFRLSPTYMTKEICAVLISALLRCALV